MDIIQLFDLILHVDAVLGDIISQYGAWAYFFLFAIIFCETGLVIVPFLPGDSLLFISGAFCATGAMDIRLLVVELLLAAVLGDNVNYLIGKRIGAAVFTKDYKWIDKRALNYTHDFFEKHGGKTITLCRFVPLVRTFAPFVAGVTKMKMFHFQLYNFLGAVLWIIGLTASGYFFGNIPIIRNHLNTIVLLGVGAAVIPVICGGLWKLLRRSIYSR